MRNWKKKVRWWAMNGGWWALGVLAVFGGHEWAAGAWKFLAIVAMLTSLFGWFIGTAAEYKPEPFLDDFDPDEWPSRAVSNRTDFWLDFIGAVMIAANGWIWWALLVFCQMIGTQAMWSSLSDGEEAIRKAITDD